MLFNSYIFLFAFLPISVVGYYALARVTVRAAAAWIAVTSIVFYAWWNVSFVFLLLASIAFNFGCGLALQRLANRPRMQLAALTAGIAANLGLLFFYKYLFPLLDWLSEIGIAPHLSTTSVILPLGISFFTFTQIGYLVDCKSGIAKGKNLLEYVMFVTFFPHLIAGPILHHREMMPQFENRETYRLNQENLAVGLSIFTIGLAKKLIIADGLSETVQFAFGFRDALPAQAAWCGALAYSMQLYFDFSGYSDMAVGLARMFGIRFPANFNSPYKATCIIDFWQRWHMTLTRYLNLYLYNPIALLIMRRRAARGAPVSRKATATPAGFATMVALPLFFTMTLAGIWHGAGLQFLVFGLLHSAYLTINHAWRIFGPRQPAEPRPWLRRASVVVAQWLITYLAVLLAQIMFRSASVHDAMHLITGMLGLHHVTAAPTYELESLLAFKNWVKIGIAFFIALLMPNSNEIMARYSPVLDKVRTSLPAALQWRPQAGWGVAIGVLAAAALLHLAGATEFLYFQF
ncbi:MBOAT family protein [Paraburkholderia strydomiana]|uniref:MBOAT family O-acyltransferase n=1 Tax=Paraburkholderia strydomiana TaxID=1245417 RepID=UPI0038BCDCCB